MSRDRTVARVIQTIQLILNAMAMPAKVQWRHAARGYRFAALTTDERTNRKLGKQRAVKCQILVAQRLRNKVKDR